MANFLKTAKEKTISLKENVASKINSLLSGHAELNALISTESNVAKHLDGVTKDRILALQNWVKYAETEAEDLGKNVVQLSSLNDKVTEAHAAFVEAHKEYLAILRDILLKKKGFDEIVKRAKNAESKLEKARQNLDKHEKGKQDANFITKKEQFEKAVTAAESENEAAQQEKNTQAVIVANHIRASTKKALTHITRAYATMYSTSAAVFQEQLQIAESITDAGDVQVEVTQNLTANTTQYGDYDQDQRH